MAWQSPKTDWAAADGVRNTDFNRIEGNILELYNTALTHNAVTVYVSPSGNDSTGNGTSQLPYRTITKALQVVPRNLNGDSVTIHITEGIYNETPILRGFTGPLRLFLTGAVTITSITVEDCTVLHDGALLTFESSADGTGLTLQNSATWVSSADITITVGTKGIVVQDGSRMSASGIVTINNTTSTGIEVRSASMVHIHSISGTGNATAISASDGSLVSYALISVTGATRTFTINGGRVYSGSQISVTNH